MYNLAQHEALRATKISVRIGETPGVGTPLTPNYSTLNTDIKYSYQISNDYVKHGMSRNNLVATDEYGLLMDELYMNFATIAAVLRVITAETLITMRIAISRLPAQFFAEPPGKSRANIVHGKFANEHMCAQLHAIVYCDTAHYELAHTTDLASNYVYNRTKSLYIVSAFPTSKTPPTDSDKAQQAEFMRAVKSIKLGYYVRNEHGIGLFSTFVISIYSYCKETKRPANAQIDSAMAAHGLTAFANGRHLFMTPRGQSNPFNEKEMDFYKDAQLTLVFPSVLQIPEFIELMRTTSDSVLDKSNYKTGLADFVDKTRNMAFLNIHGKIGCVHGTITPDLHVLSSAVGPHRGIMSDDTVDDPDYKPILVHLYRPESTSISFAKIIISQTIEMELQHILIYDKNIKAMIAQVVHEMTVKPTELTEYAMQYIIAAVVTAVRNKASVLTLQNGNPSANTIKALEDAIITAKTAAFFHITSIRRCGSR